MGLWVRRAVLSSRPRCEVCYTDRLFTTAQRARDLGMDAFTATLFYSKYQDHGLMQRIARSAAQEVGVDFLYIDFSTGWTEGIKRSKELGMYRQQYCGCIFSEQERYLESKRPKRVKNKKSN